MAITEKDEEIKENQSGWRGIKKTKQEQKSQEETKGMKENKK